MNSIGQSPLAATCSNFYFTHAERTGGESMKKPAEITMTSVMLAVLLTVSGCDAGDKSANQPALNSNPSSNVTGNVPGASSKTSSNNSLITSAIASPDRMQGDSDEDAWRLPDQVLSF